MKTVIVLAMHGIPPNDYPRAELAEFFRLHSVVEGAGPVGREVQDRYAVLHRKMRDWPRNQDNDPFAAASQELAARLREISGHDVIVGYNEFCSPSLDEALAGAVRRGAARVVVVTTMMTLSMNLLRRRAATAPSTMPMAAAPKAANKNTATTEPIIIFFIF